MLSPFWFMIISFVKPCRRIRHLSTSFLLSLGQLLIPTCPLFQKNYSPHPSNSPEAICTTTTTDMHSPTTVEEWLSLREQVNQAVTLNLSPTRIITLWICAAVTFLSGMLYALSFIKRRSAGTWIFRKDNEGYLHPNVHTALPIFAVLYAGCEVCAVVFFQRNAGDVIDPLPILLQSLAAQTLQIFAWLKTWAVLYALPSSQHRLQSNTPSTLRARNLVSPVIFNGLNILITLAVPAAQLPWTVALYLSANKFRIQASKVDLLLQKVLDVSTSGHYSVIYEAAFRAFLTLATIKREALKADGFFRKYVIVHLTWTSLVFIIFSTSSVFLLYSLGAQRKFLVSVLGNRKALQLIDEQEWKTTYTHSITSWILESAPSSPIRSTHQDSEKSYQLDRTFNPWNWKSWINFANYEGLDGELSWKLVNKLKKQNQTSPSSLEETHSTPNNNQPRPLSGTHGIEELERHCKLLTIYWYSTLWQTIIGMAMVLSYIILEFWLLFRVPSAQDRVIITFTWMNWTWGGGAGLLLGIVACVVAYSPPQRLPGESSLEQCPMSYVKPWTFEIKTPSSSTFGGKLQEKNSSKTKNQGVAHLKVLETGAGSGGKVSDFYENWSISNSGLSRSSSKVSATVQNTPGLSRQESVSSSYSSMQDHGIDPNRCETIQWKEPDGLEIEDLDTEQWDTGHFNAIHALRRGTLRDTRFSRKN